MSAGTGRDIFRLHERGRAFRLPAAMEEIMNAVITRSELLRFLLPRVALAAVLLGVLAGVAPRASDKDTRTDRVASAVAVEEAFVPVQTAPR